MDGNLNPIRQRFLEQDAAEQPFNMKKAKDAILHAKKIVVFTGAGISAESGIATFRDPDTGALWSRFDPEKFSSMQGFEENPELVWEWYEALFKKMVTVDANDGHKLVAKLEEKYDVTVITQNIDDLHEVGGSTKVLHLHGPGGVRCTKCDYKVDTNGMRTTLAGALAAFPDMKISHSCPECEGDLRPDVVWFGESLPTDTWNAAVKAMRECYICIVIGTSGQVEPAASLPGFARSVISINTRAEDHARLAFNAITLTGKAGEILNQLHEAG